MIPLKDDTPVSRTPVVTIALIALNVAVYLWQYFWVGLPQSVQVGGAIPYEILTLRDAPPPDLVSPPLTIVTSMFLHGGLMHLGGNMLFLWIFGNNVEDAMGRGRFLVFYLASGLAAIAAQTVVTLWLGTNAAAAVPTLGASGAISGVLGAYLVLLPFARVLTIIVVVPIEVPAFLFLGFWFGFQLWEGGFSIVHPQAGGGVAFFAHVGGFAFGVLTVRLFMVRQPLRPRY